MGVSVQAYHNCINVRTVFGQDLLNPSSNTDPVKYDLAKYGISSIRGIHYQGFDYLILSCTYKPHNGEQINNCLVKISYTQNDDKTLTDFGEIDDFTDLSPWLDHLSGQIYGYDNMGSHDMLLLDRDESVLSSYNLHIFDDLLITLSDKIVVTSNLNPRPFGGWLDENYLNAYKTENTLQTPSTANTEVPTECPDNSGKTYRYTQNAFDVNTKITTNHLNRAVVNTDKLYWLDAIREDIAVFREGIILEPQFIEEVHLCIGVNDEQVFSKFEGTYIPIDNKLDKYRGSLNYNFLWDGRFWGGGHFLDNDFFNQPIKILDTTTAKEIEISTADIQAKDWTLAHELVVVCDNTSTLYQYQLIPKL